VPARSYNWAFSDGTTIAVNDGTIMVSLKDGHAPTADYIRTLRQVLPRRFRPICSTSSPPTWRRRS